MDIFWVGCGVVLVAGVLWIGRRRRSKGVSPGPTEKAITPAARTGPTGLAQRLGGLFGKRGRLDDSEAKLFLNAMLAADVGEKTSTQLIEIVQKRLEEGGGFRSALLQEAIDIFPRSKGGVQFGSGEPHVISVVGVNGVGKTTTIGKLSRYFSKLEKKVLIGAADTFRAGATSQLGVWAERTGAQFVAGRDGGDPAAVAFDSLTAAKARGVDVVILDTAGRLHTHGNLMAELQKIHRVMKKVLRDAPHDVYLVLDGTMGQNLLVQARQFSAELGVTGLIVTKMDGTAKGGALLGICAELGVPVMFLGTGETADDLTPFEPRDFVEALVGTN